MRAAAALCGLALALAAHAAEFRSVQESAAVLYDAPSRAAKPLYVVSRHYPLEIVTSDRTWVKVRDSTGALAWIERATLGDKRMVVVTAVSAEVRVRPEDGAPLAFSAAQNVALELVDSAPGGWLRVRHADGASGYLRSAQVWGD